MTRNPTAQPPLAPASPAQPALAAADADSGGFLDLAGRFDCPAGGRSLSGYACRFHLSAYRDALYPQLGVAFPPQLARAVPKRRSDYLAGRVCARRALAALGLDPGDGRAGHIAIGPDREPLWPPGAIGSISHSGDRAVCIVSADPDVIGLGIDIERGIGPALAAEIRGVVVDEAEQACIHDSFADPSAGLAVAFSAKESLYKALYPQVRRFFGFEAMRLVRVRPDRAVFAAAEALAPGIPVGREFAVDYRIDSEEVRTVVCVARDRP